ncbi:permease prefix domain 1-containing protein [Sediminibacillus massiliensis]|uniref:permease prefix domain 1-containing protein n=1 Tax=Sediminibacillus massiliensis TaxID=1926277 RepID=UPI00098884BD|nr:permease prefix domain 1-containing protein [Sediminibacillus massiliensis]
MTTSFDRFVKKIVLQTEGNQEEKEDLYEELLIHLELTKEQLIQEGMEETKAQQCAMEQFGEEETVGAQIQQAMFPYRKEMLLSLSIASIIYSFIIYSAQLFLEADAYIVWLLLSVAQSSVLLFFCLKPIAFLNRRRWMNSLLIIHITLYLFGFLLATGISNPINVFLTCYAAIILILSIALVYRTTIFDYNSIQQPLSKTAKRLHALNITAGFIVVGVSLFFVWGILAFFSEFHPAMLILTVPFGLWVVLYISQMKLLSKKRAFAYFLALIPLIFSITVFVWVAVMMIKM